MLFVQPQKPFNWSGCCPQDPSVLGAYQTDAFNFKMCKIESLGSVPLDRPPGSGVQAIKLCSTALQCTLCHE